MIVYVGWNKKTSMIKNNNNNKIYYKKKKPKLQLISLMGFQVPSGTGVHRHLKE